MKRKLYSYANMMNAMTAILAHELTRMSYMGSDAPESELALYSIIEEAARKRLPEELKRLMWRNDVYEKAHELFLENGYTAWNLCREGK